MFASLLPGRQVLLAGCLAALLLSGAGCGNNSSNDAVSNDASNAVSEPMRAIVMAPAAAEMLEVLGLLDRVVGIGQYGPWPKPLQDLPVSGGYNEPNLETLLALRADVLLSVKSEASDRAHRRLEELGVQVLELDTSTHDGIFTALEEVGRAFGREDAAADIAARLRQEIQDLRQLASSAPPRQVLFVVGIDPIYVAGPGSHIDRMILDVGGSNVAHDALSPYQQVSVEAMLERLPDVIIDTSDNRPDALRGQILGTWDRWDFLPAVQNRRVFQIDPSQLVIPGMRLPQMTRLMGQLIHPEIYGEPDPDQFGKWEPKPQAGTGDDAP
jgi:iron complex transport system substrate-binding protein